MEKTKKDNKSLVIIAIVLVLLTALALTAWKIFSPVPNAGSKQISVQVTHLDSSSKVFEYKTDAEYLREVLEKNGLIEGVESTYGLWVTTVDGETADDSKEQWWGYTVNGEDAMYGVDSQVVTDGDIYVFTLNEGY